MPDNQIVVETKKTAKHVKNVIETSNNASYIRDENGKLLEHAKRDTNPKYISKLSKEYDKIFGDKTVKQQYGKYAKDSKGLLSNFYVESMNIEEYARQRLDTHVIGRGSNYDRLSPKGQEMYKKAFVMQSLGFEDVNNRECNDKAKLVSLCRMNSGENKVERDMIFLNEDSKDLFNRLYKSNSENSTRVNYFEDYVNDVTRDGIEETTRKLNESFGIKEKKEFVTARPTTEQKPAEQRKITIGKKLTYSQVVEMDKAFERNAPKKNIAQRKLIGRQAAAPEAGVRIPPKPAVGRNNTRVR